MLILFKGFPILLSILLKKPLIFKTKIISRLILLKTPVKSYKLD